ncbi:MAG: replication initiation protein, partial [Patescibacteria group bacterium]|nr:replication initiation protein [Patescibacteria group bacterium]
NFKQKVLDVAYEELKQKGDYYFEYDVIKTGRSVSEINFSIMTNKEKLKQDFREKKKQHLLNGKEKQIAQEQIRRIIERSSNIRDTKKFEEALYKKYLAGDLGYDKDLQLIKNELDRKELENMMKQYAGIHQQEELDKKVLERQERVKKFKENLEKEKEDKKM